MTPIKLILAIFVSTVITIGACSTKATITNNSCTNYFDTSYSSSTKELRSNKIPDSVFLMTNLRHLSISGMDCDYGNNTKCWMLKELPKEIGKLKNLQTLSLTLTAMQILPKELSELKNLTILDLTDNTGISNINTLTQIHSLEYLYLYGCRLTKLPENISDLKNLKELGLVGNHIDKAEQNRIKTALPNCIIKF
jgi:Leucine-rich repeat (LRR) protein